jgi:hypothetical protein
MRSAILAGLCYFAIVFAAGFVLGAIRILYVIPRIGETGAVLLELPLMLIISWSVCGIVVRRFSLPHGMRRAVMAGTAFILLLLAEAALAQFAFGISATKFLDALASPNGAIGLAGQIAFTLFPLMRT